MLQQLLGMLPLCLRMLRSYGSPSMPVNVDVSLPVPFSLLDFF